MIIIDPFRTLLDINYRITKRNHKNIKDKKLINEL